MTTPREIRVGVIGVGYMGRKHIAAYEAANQAGWPCRVVAVCDRSRESFAGLVDVLRCIDAAEMVSGDHVDLVSICTRTDSHVDVAAIVLGAGIDVLVEKPIAISAMPVEELARTVRDLGRICIPAHCMRFWPGWDVLHDAVRTKAYGRVLSATFQRLSSPPNWSMEFYTNQGLSGGALVDLHIHDADFVRWCFGDPIEVVSTGSLDHVTTLYRYGPGGPDHVVAEGGWNHAPGFGFRMRYIVVFERATLDFDLGRDPQLIVSRDGRSEPVILEPGTGYDGEVRHVLDLLNGRGAKPVVTMDDAVGVARLLDAERESLQSRRPVRIPNNAG